MNKATKQLGEIIRAVSLLLVDDAALRAIYEAIEQKNPHKAFMSIQEPRPEVVALLVDSFMQAYEDAVNVEYKTLGSIMRATMAKAAKKNRFVTVPHSGQYIRTRVASLVVDIVAEQQSALRQVIATRYDPSKRPETIVRQIKSVVGLTSREAQAVLNREDKLRENGLSEKRVQSETAKYAEKLHQARAERIARTETVFIETEAKDTAWQIARDDGLLPKGAIKEWVASSDSCDFCRDVMDGEQAPIGGDFVVRGKRYKGPPAHPHCECGLVFRTKEKK